MVHVSAMRLDGFTGFITCDSLTKRCFAFLIDCYPPVNEIIEQCGKFHLLDRLLERLFARNHKVCLTVLCLMCLCLSASFFVAKLLLMCPCLFANCYQVLIFSQWTKVLDIMDYYFSEKGLEVCRIDGSVKLDERKRQVCTNAWNTTFNQNSIQIIFLSVFC